MAAAKAAAIAVILASSASCSKVSDRPEPLSGAEVRQSIAGLWVGSAVLDNTEQTLIDRCMTRHGFEYDAFVHRVDRDVPRRFGDDVELARKEGFRTEDRLIDPSEAEADYGRLTDAEKRQWEIAMQGPPGTKHVTVKTVDGFVVTETTGGCVGGARKRIYGSVEKGIGLQQLRDNTMPNILESSTTDPKVTTAFRAWSRCMVGRGYNDFESRDGARGAAEGYYDKYDRAKARAMEIEIAVADAQCDHEAGYTSVRLAAEDSRLTEFMSQHEGAVLELLQTQRESVVRAREAIAGG